MPEKTGKPLTPQDFDKVNNKDALARIELGDELAPLIQKVLRKRIAERDGLKETIDTEFAWYKEKVAELQALPHWSWEELQELSADPPNLNVLDLAVDLNHLKNRLDKLDRLIEELQQYLEQL